MTENDHVQGVQGYSVEHQLFYQSSRESERGLLYLICFSTNSEKNQRAWGDSKDSWALKRFPWNRYEEENGAFVSQMALKYERAMVSNFTFGEDNKA